MTKERVHKALKLASHFSEIKCSQPRNEIKPDYREYSLRQLLLLLKKEVLELEDAYANGTSTYVDYKARHIFLLEAGKADKAVLLEEEEAEGLLVQTVAGIWEEKAVDQSSKSHILRQEELVIWAVEEEVTLASWEDKEEMEQCTYIGWGN